MVPVLRFQRFIYSPFDSLAFVSTLFLSLRVHLSARLQFDAIRFGKFLFGEFYFEDLRYHDFRFVAFRFTLSHLHSPRQLSTRTTVQEERGARGV